MDEQPVFIVNGQPFSPNGNLLENYEVEKTEAKKNGGGGLQAVEKEQSTEQGE